jgi:hypothetical protein
MLFEEMFMKEKKYNIELLLKAFSFDCNYANIFKESVRN